ncbi:MAG TPA: hypothetical protein VGL42_16085 [Opitutaceae bacterium]|jgi:hypothetical protein
MRTTLEIDDAVLAAAKEIAAAENKTAGAVISELARKGMSQSLGRAGKRKTGFPIFSVPPGAKLFTSADVKSAIADEGLPPRR